MTVKQLIKTLSKVQNQEARIFVKRYEGGLDDVQLYTHIDNTPEIFTVELNVNTQWCLGRHELTEHDTPLVQGKIVNAIVIK